MRIVIDTNVFVSMLIRPGHLSAIISGDKKHLVALGAFEGIPILSPAEFIGKKWEIEAAPRTGLTV